MQSGKQASKTKVGAKAGSHLLNWFTVSRMAPSPTTINLHVPSFLQSSRNSLELLLARTASGACLTQAALVPLPLKGFVTVGLAALSMLLLCEVLCFVKMARFCVNA